MKACQRAVSSSEFAEWLGFWHVEAEGSEEREPTPDELGEKLAAWAAGQNAKAAR